MSEWRKEICPNCLADREREWIVKVIPKGSPIPKG